MVSADPNIVHLKIAGRLAHGGIWCLFGKAVFDEISSKMIPIFHLIAEPCGEFFFDKSWQGIVFMEAED